MHTKTHPHQPPVSTSPPALPKNVKAASSDKKTESERHDSYEGPLQGGTSFMAHLLETGGDDGSGFESDGSSALTGVEGTISPAQTPVEVAPQFVDTSTGRGVQEVVRFTRARPARMPDPGAIRSMVQLAPVAFRPVSAEGGPLRISSDGPLGELSIHPSVMSEDGLSHAVADELFAAVGRSQAVDKFLEYGGNLIFEPTQFGGVAHYFPPGTGGDRGVFQEEFNAISQRVKGKAWTAPAGGPIPQSDRDQLLDIQKHADSEAIRILDKNELILPTAVSGFLDDLGNSILIPVAPISEAVTSDLSTEWSQAVKDAREFNKKGGSYDPPRFAFPRVADGQIHYDVLRPSQVPKKDEKRLKDMGLSSHPDGLLARGLTKELESFALELNGEKQKPNDAQFVVIEGEGVDQKLVRYWPHEIAQLYQDGQIWDSDLKRAGLSNHPEGNLVEALEHQQRVDTQDYNKDAPNRYPPLVGVIQGEGLNSKVVPEYPSTIRAQLQDGSLTNADLSRVGLSTADDGLLARSLDKELSAVSQHFNETALERDNPRVAVLEGKGLDRQAIALPPSEVHRRLRDYEMTDADLTKVGLSNADGGILNQAAKKERLKEIQTDESEEAVEIRRILSNPDSDSAGPVREAVEAGYGEQIKRYVAGNGTDGIGSYAKALLDNNLAGGGKPPRRPRNLDQLEDDFRRRNGLTKRPDEGHDRRHVLLGTATNRRGEAIINAAEQTFLKDAMDKDLGSSFYKTKNLQTQLDAYRVEVHNQLSETRKSIDRLFEMGMEPDELHVAISVVMRDEGIRPQGDGNFAQTQIAFDAIFDTHADNPAAYRQAVNDFVDHLYTTPSDTELMQRFKANISHLTALKQKNSGMSLERLLTDPSVGSQIVLPSPEEVRRARDGLEDNFEGLK